MASRKFLGQVVDFYMGRPDADISDVTFVLPNKRSAMFLKRHIQERATRAMFMPRITTLGRLVERLSPMPVADRHEQLFTLYDCYRRVLERRGRVEQLPEFDRFIFWGEIVLNDFDETDRALANPAELFANLTEYKEIQADYLEPEQKELVRAIWGDSRLTAGREEFWLHVPHDNRTDDMAAKFISLWEILGDLYDEFRRELEGRGLTTEGRQLRTAVSALRDTHPDDMPFGRVSFVGFSELTVAEAALFKRLKDCGKADFFWDVASELFHDDDGRFDRFAAESRRMERLTAEFPMPRDFVPEMPSDTVDVEVIGIPSAVGQAKMITPILRKWFESGDMNPDELLDTAIVLPDENLLLPVLSALPKELPTVNITMGLPYLSTPFAALLRSVISMQLRARRVHGETCFYYEDVRMVMSNPYFQTIAPTEGDDIRRWLAETHLYNIPARELNDNYPSLRYLFAPVADASSVEQVETYTTGLISGLAEALSHVAIDDERADLLEIKMLDVFLTEISTLSRRISAHGVQMEKGTYFHLVEKMLATARINLTGMPLRGLQVMGVLETRALDFDRIIMLSMNERIMPRRNFVKSLIPENLRAAFMLPSRQDYESDYAYHFCRLISRARSAKLMFDTRSGGLMRSGEMSRYLTRLIHVAPYKPRFHVSESQVLMPSIASTHSAITVEKTPEVMAELRGLRPGGQLRLSASALKTFKKCPLQFYLQFVKNRRGENDIDDFINDSLYGTIVHRVAELLYMPYMDRDLCADDLRAIINSPDLEKLVMKVICELYYRRDYTPDFAEGMSPEGKVTSNVIQHFVRQTLGYEIESYCNPTFRYISGERRAPKAVWHVADGLDVNFTMSIDRIDRVYPGMLRFIDYKTGNDVLAVNSLEKLFDPSHEGDAILQVLTYCEVWQSMTGDRTTDIQPVIYPLRTMSINGGIAPIIIGGDEVQSYSHVAEAFRPMLQQLVADIFDPSKPFSQCENANSCKFCPFLAMCGRKPTDY